ncbi:radical SAM protein [Rhizobium binae]|uniref:radical SAM protein n=1 Tax=Rhizobium binae TaxID=1138190 RepID=UPI001C835C8D|nr:radical SAM protein [Rhizobium binae]MBX4952755.1 radical SAM protein [Rhizobium binae]
MYFNQVFLVATESCDSQCTACDYWLNKKPRFVAPAFIEDDLSPFLNANKIPVVCISGGEPTLHPELGRIVRSIRSAGPSLTLTTSTTGLHNWFDEIRGGISNYLISLDGADRETYAASRGIDYFDAVVAWINRIVSETDSEVAVSCVLQASNVGNVEQIYDLCMKLGVHRLYFRVPDLKTTAFGRRGAVRRKTLEQVAVSESDVTNLRFQVARLLERDASNRILGQSHDALNRKVKFFECVAHSAPYREEDLMCTVPLLSLVIEPSGNCKPCFFLPHEQPFDQAPASGRAFTEVYERMLNDADFRLSWCNACQQFDGHKCRPKGPIQ